jgi:hypothetical protein
VRVVAVTRTPRVVETSFGPGILLLGVIGGALNLSAARLLRGAAERESHRVD